MPGVTGGWLSTLSSLRGLRVLERLSSGAAEPCPFGEGTCEEPGALIQLLLQLFFYLVQQLEEGFSASEWWHRPKAIQLGVPVLCWGALLRDRASSGSCCGSSLHCSCRSGYEAG